MLTDMATAFEVRTVMRGWDESYETKAFLEYRLKGFLYSKGVNYIPNIYSYVDPFSIFDAVLHPV